MALLRSLATEQGCFLGKPWVRKYSVLKLFHMQNGKIRKCISINWKFKRKRKNALIKSIAYNFWKKWNGMISFSNQDFPVLLVNGKRPLTQVVHECRFTAAHKGHAAN